MNDLIDREALLNAIENDHPEFNDGQDVANWMIKCIKQAQTVDATPVRRGKWLESPDQYWDYKCSACEYGELGKTPYCPHCGARMEG